MLTKSQSPGASRDDGVLFVERSSELVLCRWLSNFMLRSRSESEPERANLNGMD